MEFRNLTPFSTLCYKMLDTQDTEHHVVAMKVGFTLEHTTGGNVVARIQEDPVMPLCLQDEYSGEMNRSQVLQENDLSPFKPRCDVIVNGTACAPDGIPVAEMPVSLRLLTADRQVLLDKQCLVTGERFFIRHPLTGQWSLSEPEPFISLPLHYQYAFGGECRIDKESDAAEAVPAKYRLTPQQQAEHPQPDNPPVAHIACPTNPSGTGFVERWYADATRQKRFPAPRIIDPRHPFTLDSFSRCLNSQADFSDAEFQPAGFGILGQGWQPRLAKAGTYDQRWLDTRHPYLPEDFDFSHWNGAPEDQQLSYPAAGLRFELRGLHPQGVISGQLPSHQALVLLRMESGALIPQWMVPDTLILDTEKMTLAVTWRYRISTSVPLRVMEARYITENSQEG
ncbi:TPA: DUF2169 domain-containing protein [Escherichia fergusonii]|uniref:DUF2169 family type VI secretion system accessory protein n=1 Tax=Escherichia fergusonii TaxID=564 RepID=UPI000CF353C9|nr:DUF2169 domain-containing protein [Escherichia fergusonii]EFL4497410.1 DUF2169 domain-containing protein [Escherichia fergusonii]PQI96495.1 DUF2169 domain-containing protein [Escherichia fergusonii]HAI1316481.1 DUF2169 domain-containing protein [Escherichia fergusonii]HAI1316857.1 DUF2169 domain-containing protein [Escherichia fergusonii]